MKVRYGPRRVVITGDREKGKAFLPVATQLLRRAEERARLGGLTVLRDQHVLDEDSYCYVVIAGGMSAVHVVAGYDDLVDEEDIHLAAVPDFVSGAVVDGRIVDTEPETGVPSRRVMERFHPTRRCADTYELAHAFQPMERLAVEPWSAFELRNPRPPPVWSQYRGLRPTMYSGTMRQLVQVLMGFGRQRRNDAGEFSRYDDIRGEGEAGPSRYQQDVGREGLVIRYDWRVFRTHGLTRADDGRWWLVEIGMNAGVIAMPLPLNPLTTTTAFREKLEVMGDKDGLAVLDRFGGFPTGEGFPPGYQIESWIRAGRIVRLLEASQLSGFYECTPYSTQMGWAFNLDGTEAHNTASYYDEDGFMRGIHDAVSIHIGALTLDGEPSARADELRAVLGRLAGKEEYIQGIDAAIWKVGRMSGQQVRDSLREGGDNAVYDYVDRLELPPLADGHAQWGRMSEGYLVHRGDTMNLIKFPEPDIGLLVSVDMKPLLDHQRMSTRSDTVVHVFFAGNNLKWVKYFNDESTAAGPVVESNEEQCMFIGSWVRTQKSGSPGILPALYSNDFDDRVEPRDTITTTRIKSEDMGYFTAYHSECLPWPAHTWFFRDKLFRRTTESSTQTGGWMETGVAVPIGDREAYYYSVFRVYGSEHFTRSVSYSPLTDPWSYRTWRAFPGYVPVTARHPDECGVGLIKRTVMMPWHMHSHCRDFSADEVVGDAVYQPYTCSDAADEGPWSSLCADTDAAAYSIPVPQGSSFVESRTRPSDYHVYLVSSSPRGVIEVKHHINDDGGRFGLWPLISPFNGDPEVSADQEISSTQNVFGAGDSLRYQVDLNQIPTVSGSIAWPGMESGPLTYIGVIDGA